MTFNFFVRASPFREYKMPGYEVIPIQTSMSMSMTIPIFCKKKCLMFNMKKWQFLPKKVFLIVEIKFENWS